MAAPVKNFTDPTTLSKMSVPRLASSYAPKIIGPMTAFGCLPNDFHSFTMTLIGIFSPSFVSAQSLRIPIPPMGRQMVLTFPPVYKSRDGIIQGFRTPREFPAVMISPLYRSEG